MLTLDGLLKEDTLWNYRKLGIPPGTPGKGTPIRNAKGCRNRTDPKRHMLKAQEKIKAITNFAEAAKRISKSAYQNYPREILELIIFHKIHFYMSAPDALQRFRRLKSSFVDWNELRISALKEIQDVFEGVEDSLDLAIFIKDLLELLHRENQTVSLEFLAEKPLAEIRRYLKEIKGLDPATVNLVLRIRKEHPVLPVSSSMERTLLRLGLVRPGDNREQKEKYLHTLVDQDQALSFHHFLLMHSREICPPDEEKVQCSECGIRQSCAYFEKRRKRAGARKTGQKKKP